ncbi:DUF2497 domain-containing protein [Polymorphum gilvum]
MSKASQAQEPSMEEILASIRRIISDEESPAGGKEGEGDADVLDSFGAAGGDDVEMSQDDLDKLFDSDDSSGDADMAAFDEEDADDVLELTEELAVDDDEEGSGEDPFAIDVEAVVDDGDIAFVDDDVLPIEPAKARPAPVMTSSIDLDSLEPLEDEAPLTSDMTGAAVHAAFENLSTTVLNANARTLEDLVKDMLRPMLKAWLDQNLPGMVERLVRQEIERVTRKR